MVIKQDSLKQYFKDSIHAALVNQHVEADDHTVLYLINLLNDFARAENFFELAEHGFGIKPLALQYADAINATSDYERNLVLRRLGDISLFISGLFADSLKSKAVDIDYYMAMGGNAYSFLSDAIEQKTEKKVFVNVFFELSEKFVSFVDVLSEINEGNKKKSDQDLLRTYEMWIRTGSKKAQKLLQTHGIDPHSSTDYLSKH